MNKDGGCHRPPALTIDPPPTSPINDGASVGVVVNTDETTATSTSQTPPSLLAASTSSFFQKNHLTSSSSETCAESSASSTTTTTATTIGVGAAFVGQLQHPPLRRRPVSAMASLPWIAYQQQRDDSSHLTTSTPTSSNINDDDDDCALDSALFLSTSPSCFPSPIPGSVSSLALSPPGLSPLNFNDGSPFSISSTPSSSSSHINRNRFTFDHIPFVGSSSSSSSATAATTTTLASTQKSAFEVVSSVNVNEILQRVRLGTSSGSSSSATSASSTRTSQCQSISGDSGIGEKSAESSRQYLCQTCKKDFKRPDILSRHLRRHTGEKPFGCDACGRFFSRSDHLRTHRRTHTDEKPYQCTQCSYSARRRDVLTRHMITRHQTNAPISSLSASHRNVRRCHSDGDCHRVTAIERRQRRNQTITKTAAARPTSESVAIQPNDDDNDDDDDADVVVVDDV